MGFETGAGEFMQAGSYSAAQMRRSVFGWAARTAANTPGLLAGGLYSATDMQLTAAVSGLVVNISTGECLIPGSEATSQGGYHGFYSTAGSVTLATANATNPRVDLICATSADAAYTIPTGGTSGAVTVQAVTGTPTAGATLSNLSGAPTLPLSSLLLGYALVPAAATNITNANIANKATVVVAANPISGTVTQPARTAGTAYQPNTARATFVNVTTAITAAAGVGQLTAVIGPTSSPTTQVAQSTISQSSGNLTGASVAFLVPAAYYYQFTIVNASGSPTTTETVL